MVSRRSRWLKIVLLVVGIALTVVFGLKHFVDTGVRVTTSQVEAEICRKLPKGTSRADVERFLDNKPIEHWYTSESKWPDWTHIPHTEGAIIRNTSRTALARGDIEIRIEFDRSDRLVACSVREIFTEEQFSSRRAASLVSWSSVEWRVTFLVRL